MGLFSDMNIETYGFCNRQCSFCFNYEKYPQREKGIMNRNTYYKVINELSLMKFAGRIGLHHYGEPLLDKRLVKFVKFARQKCPKSYLEFASNIDFLTEKKLRDLINAGLNKIVATNYGDVENSNILKLVKKYPKFINYRNFNDITISNRAGALFNCKSRIQNKPCYKPSNQIIINWKGDVVLCCSDYNSNFIFGNVINNSIRDIWYSTRFMKIRVILKKRKGRTQIEMCKNCDSSPNKSTIITIFIKMCKNKIKKYVRKFL